MSNDKTVACCECKKDIVYDKYTQGATGYFDAEGYLVGFKCLNELVICDECYARDSDIKE